MQVAIVVSVQISKQQLMERYVATINVNEPNQERVRESILH